MILQQHYNRVNNVVQEWIWLHLCKTRVYLLQAQIHVWSVDTGKRSDRLRERFNQTLYNCTTVQLYNCTTVQLYNCTTVQLGFSLVLHIVHILKLLCFEELFILSYINYVKIALSAHRNDVLWSKRCAYVFRERFITPITWKNMNVA